jgi:hypothetical protein
MGRQPSDLPRFALGLGDHFVTILQAVFPPGAKISRDTAEVSEFHFNVSWRAREPAGLRRIVLILSTTLLEEYRNREHRPTIERRVIAYVNQKLKNSNPNDSEPWLVPS